MLSDARQRVRISSSKIPTLRQNIWVLTLGVGSILVGIGQGVVDAVFVAPLVAGVSSAVFFALRKHNGIELQGFLQIFGMLILVAGIAQSYSQVVFDQPQSFVDSVGFFRASSVDAVRYSWLELNTYSANSREIVGLGSPLNMVVWREANYLFADLGFTQGSHIGVVVNSLAVSLAGVASILMAREAFGTNLDLERRVIVLFAFAGVIWMVGSLYLSDGFALLLNTVAFLMIVKFVRRPSVATGVAALAVVVISGLMIEFVRERSQFVIYGIALLGTGIAILGQRGTITRTQLIFGAASVLLLLALLIQFSELGVLIDGIHESYSNISAGRAAPDSLGYRYVVEQPLLIRSVVGSASILLHPIPIWAFSEIDAGEYLHIKTWQFIYGIIATPLWIAGGWMILRRMYGQRVKVDTASFILLISILTLIAVAITSIEIRHFAQYYPAVAVIGAFVDPKNMAHRRVFKRSFLGWISVIVLVHIAWAIFKFV